MNLANLSGFGSFVSAQELQSGFRRKILETVAYIDSLIEAHLQVQYGFLLAGKLYVEADQANRQAVQQAGAAEKSYQAAGAASAGGRS